MPSLCITSTSVLAAPEAPQGTIMPIVGYWPIWGLLAVAILLAIFAYYLFVWWNTRKRDPLPELPAAFRLERTKLYGETALHYLELASEEDAAS